ncbi:MAG: BTAD domain-containing putative transcriptional regulator, partial [Pseudonocardiaceae bacterium]
MEFRVLGPLEIHADGRMIEVSTHKQRLVLGVLLCRTGHPVAVDALVDALWEQQAPPSARDNVRSYIHFLRRRLGEQRWIERRPSGYALLADESELDSARFESLAGHGRAALAGDDAQRATDLLADALALWRGPAFADLRDAGVIEQEAVRLEQLRQVAVESHAEVRLALGRHAELLPELFQLVARHPLRERIRAQLMVALYRSGRQSEALEVYRAGRAILLDDLGLEPGDELRRLEQAILNHDECLDLHAPIRTSTSGPARGAPASEVPAQLPLDTCSFVGREGALTQLDAILAIADQQPTAVLISALSGTAGVGKTALAVHWAHRVAERFPGGQLYMNLRGFDSTGSVMTPAEAVRGFLDAFAVPPQRLPVSLEAQTALYRSLLAGRRVLVVLDNARDAEQVRPLLPGAPGCVVVVTSRNQMSGLVTTEGAHPLTVDLLTIDEARQLLARRLGAGRVAAEPDAVDEIITRCTRLPLALAIVAARAACRPRVSLEMLADELNDRQGGLDGFASEDATTDARAVFSWSYHSLGGGAARLFRLLGLHPGPDIAAAAAASLAGIPPGQVRPLFAELARVHLIFEHVSGRFAFHDLLRAYAAELAQTLDTAAERRAAVHRALDHYLHTARAAALLLDPHRDPIIPASAQPGVMPENLDNYKQALNWFTVEHPALLAAVDQAVRGGFDTHAWGLTWTLTDFFDLRGHWRGLAAVQNAAVEAARRLSDRAGQAHAHRGLARAYTRLGRYDDAHIHFRYAQGLYGELGDYVGQGYVHLNLGYVRARQGHYGEALHHARQAHELHRAAGNRDGQAGALNALGWYHAQLGDHPQALTCCQQALALFQEMGDCYREASAWDSLGYIHHQLGDYGEAITCYQHSLDLVRDR